MTVDLACLIIVLLTAVDVLVVLAFFQRPERGRKGMMAFEILIVCLVSPPSKPSSGRSDRY
jgi:hypothetical protein